MMPFRFRIALFFLLAFQCGGSGPARGDAAGGYAGAYSVRARGADAPSWNPATLAWSQGLDLRFFSVRGSAGNNSFSIADYNRWNGAVWNERDKTEILARIPAAFEGSVSVAASAPGAASGPWAFTIENYAAGTLRIPREFARLVLWGNEPEVGFDLARAGGNAAAWTELRASHGRPIGEVSGIPVFGGATFKILRGWAYAEVTDASGGFRTADGGIAGDARLAARTARGGNGYGADLGLAARLPSGWDLALGLRNVGAGIRWTGAPERRLETATADTITMEHIDGAEDLVHQESSTEPIDAFSARLPMSAMVGAGRTWKGNWIEADLRHGFADGFGETRSSRIALGMSRRFSFVEPRFGWAAGGGEGPVYAAGLGFRILRVHLDLSAASTGGLSSPKGAVLGAGVGWNAIGR